MQMVDIFPWNDHFNTGIETIDTQHRKLVSILNALATQMAYGTSQEKLESVFEELVEYTLYHFQTEEAIWNKYLPHDPLDEAHRLVHQSFVDTALRLRGEQAFRSLNELEDEVLSFLARWLASHILDTDRHMAFIIFALQDGKNLAEAKIEADKKMSGSNRLFVDIILATYSTLSSNTLHLMRELKMHSLFEQKMKYQEKYRELLFELSTLFINIPLEDIDDAIHNALRSMALFIGADRAYIFKYSEEIQIANNTYEWCAENIAPQIQELQNLSFSYIPGWYELHCKGENLFIQDVNALPQGALKDLLSAQEIQSLITIPLMHGSVCEGFVGFDAVTHQHSFSNDAIELLKLFSKLLSNVDARKCKEEELKSQRIMFQAILDNAPIGIWMTTSTGKVKFVNKTFCDATGVNETQFLSAEHYANLLPPDATPNCIHSDKEALTLESGSYSTMQSLPFADGNNHLLEITKVKVTDAQGEAGIIGLAMDITEKQKQQSHLEYIAHYDALTGLPNRVLLADRLHQAMAQVSRNNSSLAVVYLDLDGFKAINDIYGHDNGDKLLSIIAQRMKQILRDGDTIARLGGDEFVAVLIDMKNEKDCIVMLERLLYESAQEVFVEEIQMQVSASLGVVLYSKDDTLDADQLLRQADQAMYQAKLLGKNRYYIFDTQKDKNMRTHHESLEEIAQALEEGQFVLYYQPKVNMRSGEIIGAEALIRWLHPTKGLLAPAAFLPTIAGDKLSVKLGKWVIKSVLKQIQEWKKDAIQLKVSINVDAMQLQDKDFIKDLKHLMSLYPLVKNNDIALEVLETSALEDILHVSQIIKECEKIGIHFSLDDFGTGYSSLTYLRRLPAKELKIDQSFVRDMLDDPDDLAILDGIIGLATAFDRDIIAEGVESIEHGEMLLRMGCEVGQGYIIAHPMPAESLLKWMREWKVYGRWQNISSISRADMPLLYALVEHRAWMKNITAYLNDQSVSLPVLSHLKCHFGLWIHKNGYKKYLNHPIFEKIELLHRQMHEEADKIVLDYQKTNLVENETSIDTLKSYSEELTKALKTLID